MAGAGRKWLIGCGVGCGALALLFVIAFASFGLYVRGTMKGFDGALEAREQLEVRFGLPGEFVPEPDGAIPAARMETFLAIREATQVDRERIAETWSAFPLTRDQQQRLEDSSTIDKLKAAFGIGREAIGLAREMGDFLGTRNQALLAREMGMGEYSYIYALAYWSWLGHSPETGPEHAVIRDGSVRINPREVDPDADIGSHVADEVYEERIHGQLLNVLRNLLRSLPREPEAAPGGEGAETPSGETAAGSEGAAAPPGEAGTDWRTRLEAEIAAMEADPRRVPWQDGLPPTIVASLEPYRERLEATWLPSVNPFELMRGEKKGWSIRAE